MVQNRNIWSLTLLSLLAVVPQITNAQEISGLNIDNCLNSAKSTIIAFNKKTEGIPIKHRPPIEAYKNHATSCAKDKNYHLKFRKFMNAYAEIIKENKNDSLGICITKAKQGRQLLGSTIVTDDIASFDTEKCIEEAWYGAGLLAGQDLRNAMNGK